MIEVSWKSVLLAVLLVSFSIGGLTSYLSHIGKPILPDAICKSFSAPTCFPGCIVEELKCPEEISCEPHLEGFRILSCAGW